MQLTGSRLSVTLVGLAKSGTIGIDVITEIIFKKKQTLPVNDQKEIEKNRKDLVCRNSEIVQ